MTLLGDQMVKWLRNPQKSSHPKHRISGYGVLSFPILRAVTS